MSEVLLTLVDALIDGFGGLLSWLAIGVIGFVLDLYRRFRQLRSDVDEIDRYLTGDQSDPNAPGLLTKTDSIETELKEMKGQMEDRHRETDKKLDRLLDEVEK